MTANTTQGTFEKPISSRWRLRMICINPGYSCLRGAAAIPTI
jgi:hypothetical protein